MKVKRKIDVIVIKSKSLELYKNGQIPFKLVYFIQGLSSDSDIRLVKYLTGLTEHYLRVKGYYHRHKDIEKGYNNVIEKGIKEFLANS